MFPYRFSSRGGFNVNDLRGKTLPFHKLWLVVYKGHAMTSQVFGESPFPAIV